MSRLFALILLTTIPFIGSAQELISEKDASGQLTISETDYMISDLDKAKLLIANNRIDDAVSLLRRLFRKDPNKPEHNYFLGVCMVRSGNNMEEAIDRLNAATDFYMNNDIDPGMGEPEFVWFYLVIANSQARRCEDATRAMEMFRKVYSGGDVFYVDEGFKWLDLCEVPEQMAQVIELNKAENNGIGNYIKQRLQVPDDPFSDLVIRDVHMSTHAILYGVQVGALINPSFTAEFQKLKNVEVYVDENGVYRYVMGSFTFRSQAERLLQEVQELGYPDAFIVDVNNPNRFGKELVSIGRYNVDEQIQGEVEFRVQIGAFKEKVPEEFINVYLQVDGLKEIHEREFTLLTVGSFKTYEQALKERDVLREVGFLDAFVTAFNQNRRVPVRVAIKHIESGGTSLPTDE